MFCEILIEKKKKKRTRKNANYVPRVLVRCGICCARNSDVKSTLSEGTVKQGSFLLGSFVPSSSEQTGRERGRHRAGRTSFDEQFMLRGKTIDLQR